MNRKHIRSWKKVFGPDLGYISNELKESIERPAVLILTGEMGVGKTTFSKIFTKDPSLTSPTYSIVTETGTFLTADFYRLKTEEEVLHLELGPMAEHKEMVLIEWGSQYLRQIQRELGDRFKYYELVIDTNALPKSTTGTKKGGHSEVDVPANPSRNYALYALEMV